MKAYIYDIKAAEEPDQDDLTAYWFTFKPEAAMYWKHRRAAEDSQAFFEHNAITIPTLHGRHRLRGFQIEEAAPDKFLIWCDGPFEVMGAGPAQKKS